MKKMKSLLSLLLAMLMLASTMTVMAEEPLKVLLYGQEIAFDVPPQIINDRTMVPVRAIFEAMGATVEWNGETRTVTSVRGGTTIQLTIDNPTMYVNGIAVALDSPACIINDRTLVPVRAISEAFGIPVEWFGDKRTVAVGSDDGVYENPLFHNGLAKVCDDNYRWGYVNKSGELAIIPQFSEAKDFSNGFALVKKDGKWYSIDTQGIIVAEIPYEVNGFSEGLARVRDNNGKSGYINSRGDLLVAPQFDAVYGFRGGIAHYVEITEKEIEIPYNGGYMIEQVTERKYGYINKNGERITEAIFDEADFCYEGMAAVKLNGKWGYINTAGEMVVEPQFDAVKSFNNGIAPVALKDRNSNKLLWGYINTAGEYLVAPSSFGFEYFYDGLAVGRIINEFDGKYGYFGILGNIVITPQFDEARIFSEGLAAVKLDGKWGYINTAGEMVIAPQFDFADDFTDGIASVSVNGKIGFIAANGYYIMTPQFDGYYEQQRIFDDGYIVLHDSQEQKSIIDSNGTVLTEKYAYIDEMIAY